MLRILIFDGTDGVFKDIETVPKDWPRLPGPGDRIAIAGELFRVEYVVFREDSDRTDLILSYSGCEAPIPLFLLEALFKVGYQPE